MSESKKIDNSFNDLVERTAPKPKRTRKEVKAVKAANANPAGKYINFGR